MRDDALYMNGIHPVEGPFEYLYYSSESDTLITLDICFQGSTDKTIDKEKSGEAVESMHPFIIDNNIRYDYIGVV